MIKTRLKSESVIDKTGVNKTDIKTDIKIGRTTDILVINVERTTAGPIEKAGSTVIG